MGFSTANEEDGIVGINVTPLVDITLVLLVIFMVTAKLIAQASVPMDLPKAASATATQTVLTVSVDEAGRIAVDGQEIADDAALRARAASALASDPQLRTVVQASSRARHGAVLHVIDEFRQAGITKVAFAADAATTRQDEP
jgi:biopolymer transport protein ExbD